MKLLAPWIGLIFGLFIACGLALFFNENPIHVFKILITSCANSRFDFGLTLFYTTCLIFSGLAFAIPMKAGLFHIGSEGQILISALSTAFFASHLLPLSHPWSLFLCVILIFFVSLLLGALSALILAYFKIYKQAHEVVVAIMLNFIFAAFTTWATVNHLQNPDSQNPETALINPAYQFLQNDFLKIYFENSPVSCFLILALLSCLLLHFLENKTSIGY